MTKQIKYFSLLFFFFLFLDIYCKINLPIEPYRYITKSLVIGSLLIFSVLVFYKKEASKSNLLIYGLVAFFIGDLLIIDHLNNIKFFVSMILFVIGKIFYVLKFTHKEDFNTRRLIPFLIGCFFLLAFVYNFIYHNLGEYFIPVTLYFFVTLLMTLFAFIRKNAVNDKSYYLVLAGVASFIISETIMVIKTFYDNILYQDFLIMFCYALAQYLIVLGLIFEKKTLTKENSLIL